MAHLNSLRSIALKFMMVVLAALAWVCAPSIALAQHGGGHGGGGGHVGGGGGHVGGGGGHVGGGGGHVGGGGGHISAPHFSAPARMPGPPAAGVGTRSFVAPPAVHLITPPAMNRPIVGNHVVAPMTITPSQPFVTAAPHVVIGFPQRETGGRFPSTGNSGALSFSGEGHEIWQNSTAVAPQTGVNRAMPGRFGQGFTESTSEGTQNEPSRWHPRPPMPPIFPRRPIFGSPIFAGPIFGNGFWFGAPFFGFGWGINSWWGPGCGPYGGWGFGCDAFPYYDYGYGNFGNVYSPGSLEGQIESQQNGPLMYENPTPAPLVYGGGERQLAELFLKDGTVYDVTDYWLVNDNELHFTTVDASSGKTTEQVIGFDQLDLQKTIEMNKNRGFRFVLRNEPIQEYLQGREQNVPAANPLPPGPMQPAAPPVPPQPSSPAQPPQPQ